MGSLRIKCVVANGTFKTTEYHLEGVDPTGHADIYYNLGDLIGNITTLETIKLYCIRKIDFSTMVDGATKNFQTNLAKGTITYHQNPSQPIVTPTSSSLRCIGLNRVLLVTGLEKLNQPSRKKLPHYLLASDLTQFKENVQFDAFWGTGTRSNLKWEGGRWCCFILNLFQNE
jgi:hypothetical protein